MNTWVIYYEKNAQKHRPFGPAPGRLVLKKGERPVSKTGFKISNDGGPIAEWVWNVTWYDDYVKIILSGEEQYDELVELYYDGKVERQWLTTRGGVEMDFPGWAKICWKVRFMEKKILYNKKYRLIDYVILLWKIYPSGVCALILNKMMVALIPALQTLIIAKLIDTVTRIATEDFNMSEAIWLVAALLCLIVFSYCSGSIASYFILKTEIHVGSNYTAELLRKTAIIPYCNMEDEKSYNLTDRVFQDSSNKLIAGFNYLLDMGELVVRIVSLLLILSRQVWWMGIAIVIIAVPLFRLSIKAGKENYDAMKDANQYELAAKDYQKVLAGRDSVDERTLFGFSDSINQRWYEKYEKARKITLRVTLKNFIKMKASSLITVVISFFIIAVLLIPLARRELTLGIFIATISASFSLIQLMSWQLAWLTESLANAKEYLKDLTDFMMLPEDEDILKMGDFNPVTVKSIEFKDVTFRYPNTEKYILRNFCLKLESGKHYAIVGINGAGKTTITKLLTGLYDEYQGEILINGREARTYGKRARMDMFSVVHQDFARYQISIAENIKIARDEWENQQQFDEALKLSGVNTFCAKLPLGTETYLGKIEEGSVDASGGQWQRIAIARALYHPATVRILDEPTAALDPVSESEIYRMFGEISKNVTTIFITHRMGAARLADIIIVVSDGQVAESGSHEQLVNRQGIYAEMYELQREWYK